MKKIITQLSLMLLWLAISSVSILAQAKPAPTSPIEEDTEVVKISTNLIQLDVVVTDKNGNPVTDLKPEDFEVSENGERQAVTDLSYIAGQKNALTAGNLSAVNGSNQTMPTVGEVRRTVAVVIDDAGLSAQSVALVKKELVKFISEQVQPNDLVAVIKTSGSVGILQQFTTDKKKLLAIVNNLKFQPLTSFGGLSPFEPIGVTFAEQVSANNGIAELSKEGKASSGQRNDLESLANLNRSLTVTSGSLGVLNITIDAMSKLPGRKSILYVAEGVRGIFDSGAQTSANNLGGTASIFTDIKKLREQLRGITEIANRGTIAIYTLDPRGALPVSFSASEEIRGGMSEREAQAANGNSRSNDRNLTDRGDELKASQQGLKFLSEETTGKAFINTNDLGKSLQETLDSQNGYYLLAYQPDAATFDAEKRKFNKLTVKVKRPGAEVSYRSGFFNVAEESSTAAKNLTPNGKFLQKTFSPYKYTDINLRMASVYTADEKTSTVRSFVNVSTSDLQFSDDADGNKTARFDIVALTFNENGIPIAEVSKVFEVKVSKARYEQLLVQGIAYNLTFSTKTRGIQQIKIAVRDQNTQKVGTASQTVIIPKFDSEAIGFSGILMQNYSLQEWQNPQGGKAPADAAARMAADTARRQFKKGTVLSFNYAIFATSSMRSKSSAQFTVFKDGKEVFKGAPEDVALTGGDKMQRVSKGGAFLLGNEMATGKYVLQVTVSGDAVKEPQTQQIDFELTN